MHGEISFEREWAAYLLLALPLLWWLRFSLLRYRKSQLAHLAKPRLLKATLVERSPFLYRLKTAAFLLAWTLIVCALMGLRGNPHYLPKEIEEESNTEQERLPPLQELIVVIDASASMNVADMRLKETRLEFAKETTELLLEKLQGQHVALYAFTGEATPLSPPTLDYLFVLLSLRAMNINEGGVAGTDFAKMLQRVVNDASLRNEEIQRTIVLFSDGGDQEMEGERGEIRLQNFLKQIALLTKKSWRFFVVGTGSQAGGNVPDVLYEGKAVTSALDEKLLQEIAKQGKGEYFSGNQQSALQLSQTLAKAIEDHTEKNSNSTDTLSKKESSQGVLVYDSYFQMPLAGAIAFILLILLMPDVSRKERENA